MITQGPFDLTLNTALPLHDPGATSNNPATAVQIQNASPFILDVNAGGIVLTIQSFTAQTMPSSGGGQQMSVTPIASGPSGQSRAAASLTVVWLLAGESSPMVDGPLTAAAIATSLAQSGIGGATVLGFARNVAAAGSYTLNLAPGGDLSGTGPWRLWNWGFVVDVTTPTTGGCALFLGTPRPVTDSTWIGHPASDNLAGQVFNGPVVIQNNMDQTVEIFIDYSTA